MRTPRLTLPILLVACSKFEPDFTVVAGVETATVVDGRPGAPYTLLDEDGAELLTVIADDLGQAHFAYVPAEPVTVQSGQGTEFPFAEGAVLTGGATYEIVATDLDETSGPFVVLAVDDIPDPALYADQELGGVFWSPIDGAKSDPAEGLQYLRMRDGALLSAMVRFPDPQLYGAGPWPTVIEYSGYSPSRPDRPDTGSAIANALGYATVSVNMRGSGCSGGVFDVFNRAQHADGYDIVEIVARQPWVLNNQVGMVGLSYPGISQIYVASTRPPSLAAIVPMSVIADAWEMQWPGGIYNVGFTEQWVDERERQTGTGQGWVNDRITAGDAVCADNVRLSSQNFDFESFFRQLQHRPDNADDRDLRALASQVDAAVFLTGQWQDEQTGAQFGSLLDRFDQARHTRFLLANGRHPDGYGPDAVFRWHEFLEFYVAKRIPRLNAAIRLAAAVEFSNAFGLSNYRFPPDRFTSAGTYNEALAAYEAEPPMTVLLESGAGSTDVGTPVPRDSIDTTAWPPPGSGSVSWYAGPSSALAIDADPVEAADAWQHDPDAGTTDFFGPRGYELLVPLWDQDWTRFAEGDAATYLTPPFTEDRVLGGPGVAEIWLRSPDTDDVHLQVTLTEVRPDGNEVYVQSGWLRVGHRAAVRDGLAVERGYALADFRPVPPAEWVQADVVIPAFAHPFRAGSRLRMIVSSPGRDHGTWLFEAPAYTTPPTFQLGRGGEHPTRIALVEIEGFEVPPAYPPCPSLRGQPCRAYVETPNRPAP